MLILDEASQEKNLSQRRWSRQRRTVLSSSMAAVAGYLVFGALWILLSDRLLSWLVPAHELAFWQSLKGLLFIAITALLLFLLVRYQLTRIARALRASRESERRFRGMFQLSSIALLELDDRDLQALLREWQVAGQSDLKSALADQPQLIAQALSRCRIVGANPEARQLFGISERSDLTQLPARLFPSGSQLLLAELLQAIRDRKTRVTGELALLDSSGNRRELQLNVGLPESDDDHHLILSLTDISAMRRARTRHRLLQELNQEVSQCPDLDSALRLTLQRLCEAGDWQLAQMWQPSVEGDVLVCSELKFSTGPEFDEFLRRSREFAFMHGRGLPGRVWQQQTPIWLRDAMLDRNFPRAPLAEQAGLRSAVAVPLFRQGKLVAVLEFFSRDIRREDRVLMELMASTCAQLELVLLTKLQAESLQLAEQHFQLAMAASSFGFWDWHIGSGRVQWRGNVERLFGLTEGSFDGRFESYLALLPADERPQIEQQIAAALAGSSDNYQVRHRIQLGDGQYRWLQGRGRVFRDRNGQPLSMAGTVMDITEQQLDERALPALAAATRLPDVRERRQQLLQCLANVLSIDDILLLECRSANGANQASDPRHTADVGAHGESALQISLHWRAGCFHDHDLPVLSPALMQHLQRLPAVHSGSLHEQFAADVWLAESDSHDGLCSWLDPADVRGGVVLLLFRRKLTHPGRMLALLELTAPYLTHRQPNQR